MSTQQPMSSTGSSIWALLIGIDNYKNHSSLSGCVNDVTAMRTLLIEHYNTPNDHIRMLINEQATRANILRAFREFLIDNPNIEPHDQILLHYSGHGSQMPTRPGEFEPDGLNETLVPHDSRTPDIYDIPDKVLATLLDTLTAAKGCQITVILDCCHAASGTRQVYDSSAARIRRVPADERIPPADLDAELLAETRITRRQRGSAGWALADLPYVLLAGCRDREEASEHESKVENVSVWHGALTFFTLQVLQDLPAGSTYADLHERTAALVNANYPSQMPQCEGQRDRIIFGGMEMQRDPFITVQQVDPEKKTVILGAGLVHGLHPGTELDLYPPDVRTRADLPDSPLATTRVKMVDATLATADVVGSRDQSIPQFARGVITRQAYTGLRQTVRLEAADDADSTTAIAQLRQTIEHASGNQPSPYLRLEDDPGARVDLRVRAEKGQMCIYNDTDELLVEPEAIQPPGHSASNEVAEKNVLRALESIVRFRSILTLRNEDPRSQLAGTLKLRLRRFVEDPLGPRAEELPPGFVGPGGELTISVDPDDANKNLYVVDVINTSSSHIYPHVFIMSPDYSIQRLHPNQGIQEAVRPNKDQTPYPIGLQKGTSLLSYWLPPGWDAAREYLKVIGTTRETDLRVLEQGALNVPPPQAASKDIRGADDSSRSTLEELLNAVTFGERTRHGGPRVSLLSEDWTTTQLTIQTVRKYETVALHAPEGRIPLGEELILEKPAGFTGEVTVTTLGSASRGDAGDASFQAPAGLERFPDLFEPMRRHSTRTIGSPHLVVAFDVDEASRQLITPVHPLRLELPTQEHEKGEEVFPVIFDGEDYFLVGYGSTDGRSVEVISLPPPAPSQAARRGIGRTVRLFIYKKLGRYTRDIGLHRAELKDGEVVYSEVLPSQFQPGQKVAVFVHGFTSDTRWMMKQPAQFLCKEVLSYDHLLTWDYETFGTTIQENGEQLALALKQQCGFAPDDALTVDVYAHSMGTQVARCMVELFEGYTFIDRMVLAGPPNRGTTLASTARAVIYLISTLLNNASLVPILGTANWALKQMYEQGVGVADLAVDSPVLQRLNALEKPSNVPYLVLAGENRVDEEEKNRLNRIAQKVLGTEMKALFGEENDLVIGLSSMKTVRGGAYPKLKVEVLPCDHFHYYAIPEGQEAIKKWMTDQP